MEFEEIMAIIMMIAGVLSIISGNFEAMAIFWVAASIYHLTSIIKSRTTKESKR